MKTGARRVGRVCRVLGLVLSIVVGLAILVICRQTSLADDTSAWTGPTIPSLEKDGELAPNTFQPFSMDGNRDCNDHTFITQPSGIIPVLPFFQSEQKFTACAVDTALGPIEPNGYLNLINSQVSGQLIKYQGTDSSIIPIPHSLNILHYVSAPISGLYLFLTKNMASSLTLNLSKNFVPTYNFNKPDDLALRDKAGGLLPIQTDSIGFSENGKWMIVNADNRAFIRVNLETFEIVPFGPAFTYNQGINPHPQTSITNDGRYAVVASTAFNSFKVYDLQSCTNIPTGTLTGPANCQSKELWNFIQQQVSNLKSINTVRFINDYMISLYANAPYSANTNISKYMLDAPGYGNQKIDYLALGDSYASGEGAFNYQDDTDTDINKCHLSLWSYPYLLTDDLGLNSGHSVACSGAHMNDVINTGNSYKGQVKDGLTRSQRISTDIDAILNNYSPGYIDQLDFVKTYRPKTITISMVGNDIGFGNILKRCTKPDTCYSSYEDRVELVREINNQFSNLVSLYQKLKTADSPDSRLYVLGYPEIAFNGGDCAVNVHLNAAEVQFSNQLVSYLNMVIKQAASKAGVAYIDIENSLNGHRLCETKSSNVAVNGLTSGTDGPTSHGPLGIESYHPTALGHHLLEQTILGKTQTFHLAMPVADNSAAPPAENGLDILNAPHSGQPIRALNYDDGLSDGVVYRQETLRLSVKVGQTALRPASNYQILMDGMVLGASTTSPSGELDASLQLPADTSVGVHQVDVIGDDASGQPTDITQTIVVGGQPGDVDGNGQPDGPNDCTIVSPSGQDADLDGIDDSCDGFIDDNPLLTSLYRARQGDPAKGESADGVYLERNVALAHQDLDVSDYDPDSDGWALVAKATGFKKRGSIAKFWLEEVPSIPTNQLSHYLPHLNVRSQKDGCIELTLEQLAPVHKNQVRGFTLTNENTSTCRGSSNDEDHDGLDDFTEPLYHIQYGQASRGQNSQKIYVERNIAAAEAQLGISDYSQSGDDWAIVGVVNQPKNEQLAGSALVDPDSGYPLLIFPLYEPQDQINDAVAGLSDAQRWSAVPMAIVKAAKSTCRAMEPIRLDVVKKGQGRRMVVSTNLKHLTCPEN